MGTDERGGSGVVVDIPRGSSALGAVVAAAIGMIVLVTSLQGATRVVAAISVIAGTGGYIFFRGGSKRLGFDRDRLVDRDGRTEVVMPLGDIQSIKVDFVLRVGDTLLIEGVDGRKIRVWNLDEQTRPWRAELGRRLKEANRWHVVADVRTGAMLGA